MNNLELIKFKKFDNITVNINEKELTIISGTNNSGKTSILHSLAVWEYAKILLINHRGVNALTKNYVGNGMSVAEDSFTPISIPGLRYLWKNQKSNGTYDLKIKVGWMTSNNKQEFLEIAFTLNGNNFSIKKSSSSISKTTKIPTIAYLPPFSGMQENESLHSVADRRKLIGKGQAGAVIRNILLEIHNNHNKVYEKFKNENFGNKQRLSANDKFMLDSLDTEWNQLQRILKDVFGVIIKISPFDSKFHNYIKIDVVSFKKNKAGNYVVNNSSSRDLMVEGSGFLQWLSVFSLALDKNNDVLVLDEPDAHLHSSLQSLLLLKLETACQQLQKQILMVTHSPELIKKFDYKKILYVEKNKAAYLTEKSKKTILLSGLGSHYFPVIEDIMKSKNILMVENDSDAEVLKLLCRASNKSWPNNLVVWGTPKTHKERNTLSIELNNMVYQDTKRNISVLSLRDLDDTSFSRTNEKLWDNNNNGNSLVTSTGNHLLIRYRTWRRRELENYLIIPSAMTRYYKANIKIQDESVTEDEVNFYLIDKHGLKVTSGYLKSDRVLDLKGLFGNDHKDVLEDTSKHFIKKYDKMKYISQITSSEICDDINTLIDELIAMCSNSSN